MAFTVTARHTGNSGTSSAQTHTSNSTTPTANSLFFAVWGSENDASATAPSFQTPTGGGLTYTQVTVAGVSPSYPWNGDDSFRVGLAAYRAPVGGSPSAFAITVDSSSTTATFFYGEIGFDVTGHDAVSPIVNSAIAGGTKATGNSETGTVAMGWTPAVGNLVIVLFTSGADGGGGFASPTAGAGKTFTTIANQTTASCQVGAFYRVWDGTESLTVTCSDLGDTVGNYGAIVFEVASGSGAPAPVDAGLWVPQNSGIILPQNPLYFPFTTPWAGIDAPATPVATGAGDASQRSSADSTVVKLGAGAGAQAQRSATTGTTAKGGAGLAAAAGRAATGSTGLKITTGGTAGSQRSATAETGRKSSTGAGADQQRAATSSASAKAAAGVAVDQQRAATQSTGTAATGASGPAIAASRSATSSTGKKLASSTPAEQQRSVTAGTGRKSALGTGLDQQRSAANVISLKAGTGAATVQTRAATSSAGASVAGISGPGRAAQRSSVASTGRKSVTAASTVTGRAAATGTGIHRSGGAALTASRTQSQAVVLRTARGAVRVTQRCTLSSSGSEVAPYTPLRDPAATVRLNLATATSRRNAASAAARPNQAEAEA